MTTQNGWNAPYLATKGDTYAGAGGGARPIVLPVGTNGQVLTADSAETGGVKWATNTSGFTQVVQQVFTASGTYTPTSGMAYCTVQVAGGGGGGGGVAASGSTVVTVAGSGGGGGYAIKTLDAATVGASQTVTIGAGGTGGAVGNNVGVSGGTTSFGSILSATGGVGGAAGTIPAFVQGSAGGSGTGGDVNIDGGTGGGALAVYIPGVSVFALSGSGGNCILGAGAPYTSAYTEVGDGENGQLYGGGGSGASSGDNSGTGYAGGNGANGVCIVTEYIV